MPRILVVEDEDAIALLMVELLEELEYEVQTVRNGRDAIEVLNRDTPDLVISDVMMPYASGIEVVSAMRRQEHNRYTPVILMSAATIPKLLDERVRFIRKPFNIQSVLEAVSDTLARAS